ncbi:MAG: discoidin domain-containing protein [Nitrososphaeraceae archaeon]|nr:discoidin domain-containing protein [Nitrososphaeraceae archaeon]
MAKSKYIYNKNIRTISIFITFLAFIILASNIIQKYSADAQIGKTGQFTGTNFKYIKDSELFQLNNFSVAAWFKTGSNDSVDSFLIDKGGIGSEANGENMNFGIFFDPMGKLHAGFETLDGTNYFISSPNKLNDNEWHYVTLTYDGSILKLFVDGVLVNDMNTEGAEPDSTGKTRITVGANSLFKDKLFKGEIDEIRIWDRALTNAEVYDGFANNKFNLDGQIVFVSFGDNTACKKEVPVDVRAIGNQEGRPPTDAIDGKKSTRWSNLGLNSWLILDLGTEKEVCNIDISWYKGDERKMTFTISTSSDGEIFSNIFSETSSGLTSEPEKYDIPDIKTRFLKIDVIGNTLNNWASITDIDINNPFVPGFPSPCPEIPINPERVSSIGNQPNHPEVDAVDGNLETRWSNLGLESWIDIDLGKETEICDIGIAWYKGHLRNLDFAVSVSSDGSDYRQIFTNRSSGETSKLEVYDIPDTTAKFVRITVTGNSMNNWSSISDISIFGKQVPSLTDSSSSQVMILTKVINNDGGDKQPKDFNISVTGIQATPSSFLGNPDGQVVSLKAGNYNVTISESIGYKAIYSAGCSGTIGAGDSKDCVITLDDIQQIPSLATNQSQVTTNQSQVTTNQSQVTTNQSQVTTNQSQVTTKPLEPSIPKETSQISNNNRPIPPALNDAKLRVIIEVLNIHGGDKAPSDFTFVVKGENPVPDVIRGSSDIQFISIDPGKYEVEPIDLFGYQINRASSCSGEITKSPKTCIMELIDKPNMTDNQ